MGKFYLEVCWPVENMTQWSLLNRKVERVLGNSDGAGTGFGERDMSWHDLTKKRAESMKKKVINLKIPGLKARVKRQDF